MENSRRNVRMRLLAAAALELAVFAAASGLEAQGDAVGSPRVGGVGEARSRPRTDERGRRLGGPEGSKDRRPPADPAAPAGPARRSRLFVPHVGPSDAGPPVPASEDPARFDLVEMYGLAVASDPTIEGSRFRRLSAQQIRAQAKAAFYPDLGYTYEHTEVNQNILRTGNPLFQVSKTHFPTKFYAATLTQQVFDLPSLIRWRQSKEEFKLADAEFEVARQELVLRVSRLYLETMAARDRVQLLRSELAAVEQQLTLAEGKVQAELSPESDLLEARSRHAAVQADAIDADNKFRDALRALSEISGIDEMGQPVRLKAALPLEQPQPAELSFWQETALKQNWELIAQKYRTRSAHEEVRRRQADYYPSVNFVGRQSNRDTSGTIFGGGSEIENSEFLLRLDWNPFQGGLINARTKEARYDYYAQESAVKKLERNVSRRVAAAFEGLLASMKRIEALQQASSFQEQVLRSRREAYEAGLYTALAVLDAEQDLHRVRRDLSEARYDYLLNGLVLNQAVGSLDETDILRLNERLE